MGAKVSAGGSHKRGSFESNADMNVIPFIDILLVLLIIFMVAAPPPTTDVKVDLPPPNPPQEPPKEKKVPTIVDIRDDGSGNMMIYVDGNVSQTSTLADDVLARISVNMPNSSNRLLEVIRVRADQTLAYADVMGTMALLQEKNFQTVSLVAEDAISPDKLH